MHRNPFFKIIQGKMKLQSLAFAQKIKDWLESDDRSEEAILEGARLVLQLNRNKNMYMAACRKPSIMVTKIERELRKHLAYYNDGLTLREVESMTQEVMTEIKPVVEAEKEVIATVEPESMHKACESRRGKREDHDALDPSVRALWDKNIERWKKIKETYNTCLQLAEPCDRYEYLKVLKELWYDYKKDMATYDEAKPETVVVGEEKAMSNEVKSARPYISKNLPTLEKLTADGSNEVKRQKLLESIQSRVDILIVANEPIKDETVARLVAVGIVIKSDNNAEG